MHHHRQIHMMFFIFIKFFFFVFNYITSMLSFHGKDKKSRLQYFRQKECKKRDTKMKNHIQFFKNRTTKTTFDENNIYTILIYVQSRIHMTICLHHDDNQFSLFRILGICVSNSILPSCHQYSNSMRNW